jgi:GMP synthase-like glutamine amidotransferase
MTITFIAHSTPEPALYGAMAAILAELRALPLCHLPVTHDANRFANARQYVTRQGHQLASGLVWLERLTGRDASAESDFNTLINRALKEDIVVPSMQPISQELTRLAAENGINVELLRVTEQQGKFQLEDAITGKIRSNGWGRDAFGRWALGTVSQPVMRAGKNLRVALVGDFGEHRDSYPAMLAALGDAADALALSIEVVYVTPHLIGSQLDCTLFDVDGILLPGVLNSTEENPLVGQLATVTWAMENRLPLLGINQGMHLMVAALGQQILGHDRVVMHGATTLNGVQTSLPSDTPSQQRLGDQRIYSKAGSRVEQVLGCEATLRYNQRWSLNPQLLDDLQSAGLCISGSDAQGQGAEAIELHDHPFFVGVQGQPDLQSRRERPSPLLMAFLQQVRQCNRQRDVSHVAFTKSVRLKQPCFSMASLYGGELNGSGVI